MVNIEEKYLHNFWTTWKFQRNFNEIFRKDVTSKDNIKSHKKLGLHPFREKYIFGAK